MSSESIIDIASSSDDNDSFSDDGDPTYDPNKNNQFVYLKMQRMELRITQLNKAVNQLTAEK